jgi:hypothetical protein
MTPTHAHICPYCDRKVPSFRDATTCHDPTIRPCGRCLSKLFPNVVIVERGLSYHLKAYEDQAGGVDNPTALVMNGVFYYIGADGKPYNRPLEDDE